MKAKITISLIGFPLFIVLFIVAIVFFRKDIFSLVGNLDVIQSWIDQQESYAGLFYIFLQWVQVVLFFIPGEFVQIAGGYFFSPLYTLLFSITGILIGSLCNYGVGYWLGRGFFINILGEKKVKHYDSILGTQKSWWIFFFLFLIPGFPKDSLCYIGGFGKLNVWRFLALSILGRQPGLIGSIFIGHNLYEGRWGWVIGISVLAIGCIVVAHLYRDQLFAMVMSRWGGKDRGRKKRKG